MILGLVTLFFFSLPFVSQKLYAGLEKVPHLAPQALESLDAQAIVVLTAWQNEHTPEFGRPVSGVEGLSRVRYAAFLHDKTHLPVLVTGGSVFGDGKTSLAATMAFDLESGFKIKANWLEESSRTTQENALYSHQILEGEDINKILLVSSAFHLKRATLLFEKQGFTVIPAPTFFVSNIPISLRSFIPNAFALNDSAIAMHEWLGYLYYRITL